jgi:hypothetical protein
MKQLHLTVAALLFCSLFTTPVAGIAGEVGIFLNNQTSCKINSSEGSSSCRKDAAIEAGDVITSKQDPSSLSIQWLSPGLVRLEPVSKGQHRVVFTPPPKKESVVSMVVDLLGFARRGGRFSHGAVTRGGPESYVMLPGDGATLLAGQPVTLSWCTAGIKQISITTADGSKVKEIAVPEGQRSVTITPEELGLASKLIYRWEPLGAAAEGGHIRVLESETAMAVTNALKLIDEGQWAAVDKNLKKAAYLQFMSNNFADDYTFGWLQYSLVNDLSSQATGDDLAAVKRLKAESGVSSCM